MTWVKDANKRAEERLSKEVIPEGSNPYLSSGELAYIILHFIN